jgi:fucose 4-O-acetylase-like acetyltransferase
MSNEYLLLITYYSLLITHHLLLLMKRLIETPYMPKNKPERQNDIDWLRVLAMLTIFLFHCARFFDHDGWHVKNNQLNLGMSVFVGFLVQWIMPIFFILSGKSTYFALTFRKGGQYIQERFRRLIVPLIFGIFVLISFLDKKS